MAIAKSSPNLYGVITRTLEKEHFTLLEKAYDFAFAAGGAREVDFQREEGVSFNPRAARIALILIGDAKVKDPAIIAAGILSTSDALAQIMAKLSTDFPANVVEMTLQSQSSLESIKQLADANNSAPALIFLANWLDRARHLHQSQQPERERMQFLQATEEVLPLAEAVSPALSNLLVAWKERFLRLFEPKFKVSNE